MTHGNKSIVQQALTALVATGDVDALAPLLSDDFLHHRPDATSKTKSEWLAAVGAALVPLAGDADRDPARAGRRRSCRDAFQASAAR
ncbi:hypothetical protein ACFSTC_38060 [Nonomuraea ferruginea]